MSVKTTASSSPASRIPMADGPSGLRRFLRYWFPVLIWMVFIFGLSTTAGSPRNTSWIIGPIVRWLVPGISDEAVGRVVLAVRKTAHVSEYGVLALLAWRARRKPVRDDSRPWRWSEAAFALIVAVLFAITDEWHQTFVPSREGSPRDVLIDATGATLALVALWRFGRWRKHW
jgi:VanZ family protein